MRVGVKKYSLDDIERGILRVELLSCMGRDQGIWVYRLDRWHPMG